MIPIDKFLNNQSSDCRLVVEKTGTLEFRKLTLLESLLAKFGFGPAAFKNVVEFCNTHSKELQLTAKQKTKFFSKINDYNETRLPITFKKVHGTSLSFLRIERNELEDIQRRKEIKDLLKSSSFATQEGVKALIRSIEYNYPEFVAPLLEKGVNVNTRKHGHTPLQMAAHYNNVLIAKILIEHGANTSSTVFGQSSSRYGYTAAMIAAVKCRVEFIKLCLDNGIDVNAVSPKNNYSLLMLAAQSIAFNPKETFALLIKEGANVNLKDDLGQTALHMAISSEPRIDAIETLLGSDTIDVNIKDNKGKTALYLAAEMGLHDVVKALLNKNADRESIFAQNADGTRLFDKLSPEIQALLS